MAGALGAVDAGPATDVSTTTLRSALLPDGRLVDISIEDGRVAAIHAPGLAPDDSAPVVDLDGRLVLPALAEPHAHLDKTLTAVAADGAGGDLSAAIESWQRRRSALPSGSFRSRALAALRRASLNGVTVLRSHVDATFDPRAIHELADAAHAASDAIDVQLVAGAGLPLTGTAGRENLARLRDVLEATPSSVGGAPSLDASPREALDRLAEVATEFGRSLDLHIDETLDPASFLLPHLADLVDCGFKGAVTAGHCVSLASQPLRVQHDVAEDLARTGVTVVTLPQTNLYLQGRGVGALAPRGLTSVHVLVRAGVTVVAGSDNIADPFNPVGRGDPLETAALLVAAGHVPVAEARAMVSETARAALGAPPAGVRPGDVADLVALRASSELEAVGRAPADRIVLRAGRVVAASTVEEKWLVDSSAARR